MRPLFGNTLSLISSIVFSKDDDIAVSEFFDTYLIEKLQDFSRCIDDSVDSVINLMHAGANKFETLDFEGEVAAEEEVFMKIWRSQLSTLKSDFMDDILLGHQNEQCVRFEERFPAEAAFINYILRRRNLVEKNLYSSISYRASLLILVSAVTKKYCRYDFDTKQKLPEGMSYTAEEGEVVNGPYKQLREEVSGIASKAGVSASLGGNSVTKFGHKFNQGLDGGEILASFGERYSIPPSAPEGPVAPGEGDAVEGDATVAIARQKANRYRYVTGGEDPVAEELKAKISKNSSNMVVEAINLCKTDCKKGSVVPLVRMYATILISCFEQLVLLHASRRYLLNIIKLSGDYILSTHEEDITKYLTAVENVNDEVRSVLYDLKKIAEYSSLRNHSSGFKNIMSPYYDKISELLEEYLSFGKDINYAKESIKASKQILKESSYSVADDIKHNINAFKSLFGYCNMASQKIVSQTQVVMTPGDHGIVQQQRDYYSSLGVADRLKLSQKIKEITTQYLNEFYKNLCFVMEYMRASGLIFLDASVTFDTLKSQSVSSISRAKIKISSSGDIIHPAISGILFSRYDEKVNELKSKLMEIFYPSDHASKQRWVVDFYKEFSSPQYFSGLVPFQAIVTACSSMSRAGKVNKTFSHPSRLQLFVVSLLQHSGASALYLSLYLLGKICGYKYFVKSSSGQLSSEFTSLISCAKNMFAEVIKLSSLFGFCLDKEKLNKIIHFVGAEVDFSSVKELDTDEVKLVDASLSGEPADALQNLQNVKARYCFNLMKGSELKPRAKLDEKITGLEQKQLIKTLKSLQGRVVAQNSKGALKLDAIIDGARTKGLSSEEDKICDLILIYPKASDLYESLAVLSKVKLVPSRPAYTGLDKRYYTSVNEAFIEYSKKCTELNELLKKREKSFRFSAKSVLYKKDETKKDLVFYLYKNLYKFQANKGNKISHFKIDTYKSMFIQPKHLSKHDLEFSASSVLEIRSLSERDQKKADAVAQL
ncbi:hypothetical protein [Piscirickettsia litoralis]|uniref:Uncharacterized protein n=1 Tax=Piscirickettsia litoralis TaxID=1891921 RepID=A0ABX3A133_9GAMM|nr:hypothetical protein [Piscirickettsia litoralis]ODN42567.1 hypothetical protein BGC07_06020 [Piscirickettsia litoralis]